MYSREMDCISPGTVLVCLENESGCRALRRCNPASRVMIQESVPRSNSGCMSLDNRVQSSRHPRQVDFLGPVSTVTLPAACNTEEATDRRSRVWKGSLCGIPRQDLDMPGVRQAVYVDSRRTAIFPRERADQHPGPVQPVSFSQEGQTRAAGSRPDRGDVRRMRPLDHGSICPKEWQPGLLLRMPGHGPRRRSVSGGGFGIIAGPHRNIDGEPARWSLEGV